MYTNQQWRWVTENRRARRPFPVPLGQAIEQMVNGPLFAEPRKRDELERVLASVLGPERSRHVTAGKIRSGTLVVYVDDPAYRYELRNFQHGRILSALKEGAPSLGVRNVEFKLDPRAWACADERMVAASRGNPQA